MDFQKHVNKMGYKKNSPYKNISSLLITSNILTTEDMAFPILAVSDQGDTKILQPNTGMHKFKGNKVREYKLQSGGVDPGVKMLDFLDKRSQRQKVEDTVYQRDSTKYVGSPQYYLDMQAGKVPHVADMLLFGEVPGLPSGKSKSKDRFREKQEGGEMQTYLSSLSPEEQNAFLDQYEQVFQDGGQLQVPVSMSNAELEKGETVLGLDGALKHVDGKRHSSGGTPVILENGEKVFSDYLVVPDELQKILGVKKKTTFAQASKKYDTKKEFKVLEDSKDPYARETAEFSLNNKLAMLETVFQGQESLKEQKQTGRKLQTSYQKGGKYQEGKYFNHSGISDRFETLPDGKLYDPVTKNFYKRESDGNYTKVYSAPVQESSYRGPEFPLVGDIPVETKTGYQLGTKDKFPSMRTQPVTENWDNGYRGPQFPIAGPTQVSQPTQLVVGPAQPISQPTTPVQKARTARKLSGNPVSSVTQPSASLSTPRTGFKPTYSAQMPTPEQLAELGPDTFQEKMPYLPNPNEVDERTVTFNDSTSTSSVDPKVEARQSWFARNKDKFGINSKLAGTILDIGLVLSDKLQVDNASLYDHQKQPLFNRFYDYDNKETQRVAQTQINGIMNSNLPESVKQARIAEVTAQSQNNQSQVDFNNAQRYDQKQSADLNKLQSYQDANLDARINDVDNYRQRKARVEDLKSRFRNNKKEAIVSSVKNYLGYADELRVANELSPYFETSAITGRTKYKPQSNSNLKSNALDQFAQSDQTTQNLPNGASLVKQGNMIILVSADGSAKQIDIKG
jgi:hypothetical protein